MSVKSLVILSVPLLLLSSACAEEEIYGENTPLMSLARSVAVEGDFVVTHAVPTSVLPTSNGECEIELETTFEFSGDMEGAFDAVFLIDHHGPCDQPANEDFTATGIWEGLVNGAPVVFDFSFDGDIDISRPVDETAEGDFTVLVNGRPDVTGWLDLVGPAGESGSYEGRMNVIPRRDSSRGGRCRSDRRGSHRSE